MNTNCNSDANSDKLAEALHRVMLCMINDNSDYSDYYSMVGSSEL